MGAHDGSRVSEMTFLEWRDLNFDSFLHFASALVWLR